MTTPILTTSNLGDIYPEVSEELCNKHVKQLSKLKTLFGDIYDQMEPEGYVVVNGVAKVVDLYSDLQLNFALENGIMILFSKTYKNEGIFINGNHIDEEIQFNKKGRHEDGIHQKIDQMKDLIKNIRKNASSEKQFYGGIIYIHSSIGQHHLGYNQCFMLGLAVSLLMIHEEQKNYSKKKLGQMITQCDEKLSKKVLCSLLEKFEIDKIMAELYMEGTKYENQVQYDINLCPPKSDKSIGTNQSHEAIKMGQKNHKTPKKEEKRHQHQSIQSLQSPLKLYREELKHLNIKLKENHKLIFCKMDISKSEELYFAKKMDAIRQSGEILDEKKLHRSDIVNERGQIALPPSLKDVLKEEECHLLEYCQEIRCLMSSLVTKHIQFDQFLAEKHKLDIAYSIHDEAILDLLDEVKRQIKYLDHFCVVEGTILLISMDKHYYAQIMGFLRKMLNEYKFSTYKYLQSMKKDNIDDKLSDICQVMFTSMPSLGCALYQPKEDELWM